MHISGITFHRASENFNFIYDKRQTVSVDLKGTLFSTHRMLCDKYSSSVVTKQKLRVTITIYFFRCRESFLRKNLSIMVASACLYTIVLSVCLSVCLFVCSLEVQNLVLELDSLLEKSTFSSTIRIFMIRFRLIMVFWKGLRLKVILKYISIELGLCSYP
jgi:hypothetical protein